MSISSPANGTSVGTSVHVVASATTQTAYPIASMIVYVDNVRAYTVYASNLDTYLTVAPGTHTFLVKSWDNSGAIYQSAATATASGVVNPTPVTQAITVTAPAAGATVSSSTRFLATARSQTAYPIASMMLFVDDVPVFTAMSASLDTTQSLATGTRRIIIKSWDNSGRLYEYPFTVNVNAAVPPNPTPGGTTVELDQIAGWQSCDACAGAGGAGPTATHSLTQGVASPSMDGASARFWMGGSTPYSDVLWWKKVLVENQVAQNRTLHNFVYDLYFYTDNGAAAQSIEWDVNQFVDGRSYIFGSQCSYRSAGTWDIWDNVNSKWVSTGISCGALQSNTWNHVVLEFERTTDNKLRYIAMTLNGNRHYLNWYYPSTATTWSGVTVNYQMDGNYQQANYSTWVDKMRLTYW